MRAAIELGILWRPFAGQLGHGSTFEFIWEEVTLPLAYRDEWRTAERIMTDEAVRVASSADAERAIADMVRRSPVARTEVEPRVFVRATDDELAARFVVPVRTARRVTDEITRRILDGFDEAGIEVDSDSLRWASRVSCRSVRPRYWRILPGAATTARPDRTSR